jgi:hypothetical protein
MEYTKPEVRRVGEALASIQSQQMKGNVVTLDIPHEQFATTPAYEADE